MSHWHMEWRKYDAGPHLEAGRLSALDLFPEMRTDQIRADSTEIAKRFARLLRAQGIDANAHTGHVNYFPMPLKTLRYVLEEMGVDWPQFKANQKWLLVKDQVPPG